MTKVNHFLNLNEISSDQIFVNIRKESFKK